MVVYVATFALSLLIFYFVSKGKIAKTKNSKLSKPKKGVITKFGLAIFLASLPPIFISAVRYFVGTDYLKTYYTGFYRIMDGSTVDGFEIGFYLLNRIIQLFSDNVFWLFAITSIIFVGTVYKAIADISLDVPLSIALFFVTRYYFVGMNGVRQFIGLAFLTYSLRYVFERNPKKFSICIALASSFHYTCLLFAPVYFLSRYKLNRRRIINLILVDFLVFTLGIPVILQNLLNFFTKNESC